MEQGRDNLHDPTRHSDKVAAKPTVICIEELYALTHLDSDYPILWNYGMDNGMSNTIS